jgi:hypothetical protein
MENKRMSRCGYQSLFYVLFAWILAACGGGGGGGVDPNAGNIGGGGGQLTLTPVVNQSSIPYTVDVNNSLILNTVVTNSSGTPVSNAIVTYSVDTGSINVASTLTTATGTTSQAATITPGDSGIATQGTITITARTSDGSFGTQTVLFTSAENCDETCVVTTPTPTSTTITLAFLDSNGIAYPSQQAIPFGETITIQATVTPEQPANTSVSISALQEVSGVSSAFGRLSSSSLLLNPDNDATTDLSVGTVTLETLSTSGTATITGTLTSEILDQQTISIIEPSIIFGFANQDNSINSGTIKLNNDESLSSVTLSDGGTALLAAELFIEDAAGTFTHNSSTYNRYTQAAKIDFASICSITPDAQDSSQNKSEISYSSATETNTINGLTTATYKTISCTDTDTVQATTTINNTQLTATTSIAFNAQVANSLEFVSVKNANGDEINNIALQGSPSTLDKSAKVTFRVRDDANLVSGVKVFFELTSNKGGVTLSTDNTDTATYPDGEPLISDANGEVTVTVNSGDLPTDIAIKATIEDPNSATTAQLENDVVDNVTLITATSTALTVSTGYPHQGGFSLAASNLVPNAYNYQGVPVTLTVRASDLSQQAAPDGTSINFKAENGGGQLVNENEQDTSSCQLSNGVCSITWRSQELTNKPDVSRAFDNFLNSSINNMNVNQVDVLLANISGTSIYNRLLAYESTIEGITWDHDSDTSTAQVARYSNIQLSTNNVSAGVFTVNLETELSTTSADLRAAAVLGENQVGSLLNSTINLTDGNTISDGTNFQDVIIYTALNGETATTDTFTLGDIIGLTSLASVNVSTLPYTSYTFNPNDRYGLVEILSWTTGEETFTDSNGDGLFNGNMDAEEVNDLAEPFTDNNQSGTRNTEAGINLEEFEDTNENGNFESTGNAIYNGFRCDASAISAGHCPTTNKLIDVRDDITLIAATNTLNMASIAPGTNTSFADFRDSSGTYRPLNGQRAIYKGMLRPTSDNGLSFDNDGNLTSINIDTVGGSYSFTVMLYDQNGNPPPAGTQISLTAPTSAKLSSPSGTLTVPVQSGPYTFTAVITRDPDADDNFGNLEIKTTTPSESTGTGNTGSTEQAFTVGVSNNNVAAP